MDAACKKINAQFFRSEQGTEPVRKVLRELGRPIKTQVGDDIRFVELNWRVDKPYVDRLRGGRGKLEKSVYEVRHTVEGKEYRTLFFVYEARMVLVHFFQKKTQKTPLQEIEVAWQRMKLWVREQRRFEAMKKWKGR